MYKLVLVFIALQLSLFTKAQTPKNYTSSEILLQLKKLNILGSVLYVAAHPDDENTRLLGYLANEKLYRTGYLSLTRGDGGQNLIGDEQGIDLGLIRTQELLAARRIDGAEQFFSRAYDFGFCKTSAEALSTWNHDKILSDVVWVIRKFRPDVIITRFPEDSRAGHGHHAASAILAREAFEAAADPARFPEQLTQGVAVWSAKRLLWNTFNFGSSNTQSEDQFKVDAGLYNPLLGKSYGEIAAFSRSQHKSQGFGVPAQRGPAIEYFATVKGDKPVSELMDNVTVDWRRTTVNDQQELVADSIEKCINGIISNYSSSKPANSLPELIRLYWLTGKIQDAYWREQKLQDISNIIEACSGIYLEASTSSAYAVHGDSLKINFTAINRLGANNGNNTIVFKGVDNIFDEVENSTSANGAKTIYISEDEKTTQPYWLVHPMERGSFNVTDQQLIGKAENDPLSVVFTVTINGGDFKFKKPIRYKYTDPVKGEVYQPLYIVPAIALNITPAISLVNLQSRSAKHSLAYNYRVFASPQNIPTGIQHYAQLSKLSAGDKYAITVPLEINSKNLSKEKVTEENFVDKNGNGYEAVKEIDYDHIPSIKYFKTTTLKILVADIKTNGRNIGYIQGAGDKVPQALEQLGYKVTLLKETDITTANLKQFNAIVTGVRAYNTNQWLSNSYDVLMQYVKEGGVLLAQYNTNNSIGPVKAKIAPYPFTISRNRITDEEAGVSFLLPANAALNYPNKITIKDFEGWIQERSIYNAESIDSNYQRVLTMKDPNEEQQDGSLIIADYGKGKFIYTGLVFFRELPAGISGAYRLFANLVANRKK